MNSRIQKFGSTHTGRKLDVVARYLSAYVTVMKRQSFDLHYVDGFAGSGASASKQDPSATSELGLFDTSEIIIGSPLRALNIDPPFDHYLFIDSSEQNVASLEADVAKHANGNRAEVARGDANERIAEFCEVLRRDRSSRAVVFLDPFGLAVKWGTIEELAKTGKVDLWYLVPVEAMSRQIKDNGEFLPGAIKIDELWGSDAWRKQAVRKVPVEDDLFGGIDERLEKISKAKQFSEMFRDHLKIAFDGRVADTYLPLGRGRRHEFSLMFACANPRDSAFGKALRIANHILRTA